MYRKGVSIILLNNKNQILLENLISFATYYFALPGGGRDLDESYEATVKRELNEELGISESMISIERQLKKPIRFVFKCAPLVRDGVTYIGQERQCFLVKFKGKDTDIKLNKDEVRRYVWANYNDLSKYLLFDGQLKDVNTMIKELCSFIVNE
jgi:putative (di)nucleoside polyphosphate hydrolase